VTGVAFAVVALALAVGARGATLSNPPLTIHRTLARYVRVPGKAPALAWPGEGEAAVEVENVGGFGSSGPNTPVPIASVAKVMTAYLTLLDHPLPAKGNGFVMTVTPEEVSEEQERAGRAESVVAVSPGERLTERQALEALMLPSANNIAELLAIYDAGGRYAFVARMNRTAKRLGMRSTSYTDPSGFEDSTRSTAADQLKLARVAMAIPAFADIVDESSAELPVAGTVTNYDTLLGHDGYVGIKTGSDRAAGGCFMFAKRVVVAGRHLSILGVVLGQHSEPLIGSALIAAERLGNSAAAALRVTDVLPAGASVLTARAADGARATAATATSLREIGWAGLAFAVQVAIAPALDRVRAGQRIATVAIDGLTAERTAAVAARSVGALSLSWRLEHVF
jgi:D-alanyl-D-alanine carboxypeptidase (penicillin-binding protein 5/6)